MKLSKANILFHKKVLLRSSIIPIGNTSSNRFFKKNVFLGFCFPSLSFACVSSPWFCFLQKWSLIVQWHDSSNCTRTVEWVIYEIKHPLKLKTPCLPVANWNYEIKTSSKRLREVGLLKTHCMKSVQIWSFFWPVFPVFGLNAVIYSVNLSIKSEYMK